SNTSPQTIINGSVCYSTAPTTPPLTITGSTDDPCPPSVGADQGLATANLLGPAWTSLGAGAVAVDSVIIGSNPPGTIPPGCYSSGGAMNVTLSTTVTLNGAGVYIFRPGGALDTGANSLVVLAGGACASDVFWVPVGATTLGANASLSLTPTFVGNILDAAGITIGHFANLTGRALACGGPVTTDANTITVPSCASFVAPVAAIPTLSEWTIALLAALLGIAAFAVIRRKVPIGRRRGEVATASGWRECGPNRVCVPGQNVTWSIVVTVNTGSITGTLTKRHARMPGRPQDQPTSPIGCRRDSDRREDRWTAASCDAALTA